MAKYEYASEKFHKGDFNYCNVRIDSETKTATVTIYRHGWKKAYKFKAKNLYSDKEKVIYDEKVKENV